MTQKQDLWHMNTWDFTDEERERLRRKIMGRWRRNQPILQPPRLD